MKNIIISRGFNFSIMLIIGAMFSTSCLSSEDESPGFFEVFGQEGKSFVLHSENDAYLETDNNYTNGIRFSLFNTYKDEQGKIKGIWNGEKHYKYTVGMHLANNIYTSSNIRQVPDQISEDDRPYAGWTYIGMTKVKVYEDDSISKWEYDLGCIGPCAGSKQIQTEWHALSFIDAPKPMGWDSQIENDIALQVFYDYHFPVIDDFKIEYGKTRLFDVSPSMHLEMGTIFNSVGIGWLMRVGMFKSYYTGRGVPSSHYKFGDFSQDNGLLQEIFVFIRAKARYVFNNATIEGGLINSDSPFTQDIRNKVIDLEGGMTIHWRSFSLSVSAASRSTEIEAQPYNLKNHKWASVVLDFHF